MSDMQTHSGHEQMKKKAALLSLAAAVFLTSVKLVVGWYTNSLAILSEALHSGLDLVAALMTFYAIRVASKPADRRHPYGHGSCSLWSAPMWATRACTGSWREGPRLCPLSGVLASCFCPWP